jgi:hypothetical protein
MVSVGDTEEAMMGSTSPRHINHVEIKLAIISHKGPFNREVLTHVSG